VAAGIPLRVDVVNGPHCVAEAVEVVEFTDATASVVEFVGEVTVVEADATVEVLDVAGMVVKGVLEDDLDI
jgi:hypothetical protein